jgi:hypothetical protein
MLCLQPHMQPPPLEEAEEAEEEEEGQEEWES